MRTNSLVEVEFTDAAAEGEDTTHKVEHQHLQDRQAAREHTHGKSWTTSWKSYPKMVWIKTDFSIHILLKIKENQTDKTDEDMQFMDQKDKL